MRLAYRIHRPRLGLGCDCHRLLTSLPSWFGIPESNQDYTTFVENNATWSATDSKGSVVGLLAPLRHFPEAAELHLIAVDPNWHRHGIGLSLLEAFEKASYSEGVRVVQVKTIGPSDPDPNYAKTRAFYTAVGFVPMEELRLWAPDIHTLIMVKSLHNFGANLPATPAVSTITQFPGAAITEFPGWL